MKNDKILLEQAYEKVQESRHFICGFPGIGKSYLAKERGYHDSDSSKFPKTEEWPQNYIEHLKSLDGVTLISTHLDVRNSLHENDMEFSLIYPDRSLKQEYIKRYKDRGSPETFISLLSKQWDEWITEMEDEHRCSDRIVLQAGEYASDVIG